MNIELALTADAHEEPSMLAAALEYARQGWKVFPLAPGTKQPNRSGGFYNGTTDEAQITQWWTEQPEANIGIRTGEESRIVVLDVDVKNGRDGLATLVEVSGGVIPETLTASTPTGGKHLYFNSGGVQIPNSASKIGDGLDVRGERGYIVAPPSKINGGRYRWENPKAPICQAPHWLTTKKADVGGDRVREGERNSHIFSIACSLRGKAVPYEEAEMAILLAAAGCDPPLPTDEALRTLDSAYGFPEGGGVPPEIDQLNQKHAVVMLAGQCRVMSEEFDPVLEEDEVTFTSTSNFKDRYSNRLLDGKKLGEAWLAHPERREYKGVVFAPGKEIKDYFNLWQGHAVKSRPGDCRLFLEHVRENIAGNEEVYTYLLAWMADIVQRPWELPGIAVVLRGKQGTGKGVFCNQFGRLFGRHYKHLAHSKHLTGNFNSHLKDALVVFADEAFWGGRKEDEGVLKALITEDRLTIEGKGQNQFFVKNHIHLLMASNNEWVVPASFEERRFLILDVSDKRQQDHAYFAAIREQMDSGGLEALLHLLENFDLSSINLRKVPKTAALFETKLLSLTPIMKFWYDRLQLGTLRRNTDEWEQEVETAALKQEYLTFAKEISVAGRFSDEEFGKQLRKVVPGNLEKFRPMSGGIRKGYHYRIPPLSECRQHFEKLVGMEVSWEEDLSPAEKF